MNRTTPCPRALVGLAILASLSAQTSVIPSVCADLPGNARAYVEFIERFLGVPVSIISVGPGREQTLLS